MIPLPLPLIFRHTNHFRPVLIPHLPLLHNEHLLLLLLPRMFLLITLPPRFTPPPVPRPQSFLSPPLYNSYDETLVGKNHRDSLAFLRLPPSATKREVKIRYRALARKYHPDKVQTSETGMTKREAEKHFQLINNAQKYLRSHFV